MSSHKRLPLITDPLFSIRVPSFIVVHGHVLYTIGLNPSCEGELEPGKPLKYRRHGSFELQYAGDDHAVLKHTTLLGWNMYLFVPQKKHLAVSNGSYEATECNYASYQASYASLKDKPLPKQRIQIVFLRTLHSTADSSSFN